MERQWVDYYKERVRAVARHAGILDAPAPPGEVLDPRIWHLNAVNASATGIFLPAARLGQPVRAGQPLGTVVDAAGEVVEVVRAPTDGLLGGCREHAGVRPGQTVFTLWSAADTLLVDGQ